MVKNNAKLIVLSDTHGNKESLELIRQAHPDADCFIHCGDSELRPEEMKDFITVQGNSDIAGMYPFVRRIEVGKYRILVKHGHDLFGKFVFPKELARHTADQKCNILLFGHSHEFCDEIINGIHIINPGAVTRPVNGSASYAEVIIDRNGVDVIRHNYVLLGPRFGEDIRPIAVL